MKITKGWLLVVCLLLVMIVSCSSPPQNVLSVNLQDHKNLALHIHPHLEIVINGEKQVIPANIGITETGMRVMHTHDVSGGIHIESPETHQFYLADFFDIWGKTFNGSCILDSCVDSDHALKVFVNGVEDSRLGAIPLHDQDQIQILFMKI